MADQTSKPEPTNSEQTPPPPNDNQKKIVKIVLIVVGVLLVLGLIGMLLLAAFSAKVGEKVIEEVTDTEIQQDGDSVSVESEDGSYELNSSELPEGFPSAAPIYESADLTSSSSYSTGDTKVWTTTFTSDASVSDVYGYYQDLFNSDDWEVQSTVDTGDAKSITAVNEDENLRVGVNASEGAVKATDFTITASETK